MDRKLLRAILVSLVLGSLVGVATRFVHAQPAGGSIPLPLPFTGNEIVSVLPLQGNGQPGAIMANVTLGQIAQFITQATFSTTTAGTVAATTPTTVLTLPLTGALTFTLPAAPTDGEVAVIVNGSGRPFTFTITATGGGTVQNPTDVNMPAGGSARWRWTAATMTWTRIA